MRRTTDLVVCTPEGPFGDLVDAWRTFDPRDDILVRIVRQRVATGAVERWMLAEGQTLLWPREDMERRTALLHDPTRVLGVLDAGGMRVGPAHTAALLWHALDQPDRDDAVADVLAVWCEALWETMHGRAAWRGEAWGDAAREYVGEVSHFAEQRLRTRPWFEPWHHAATEHLPALDHVVAGHIAPVGADALAALLRAYATNFALRYALVHVTNAGRATERAR